MDSSVLLEYLDEESPFFEAVSSLMKAVAEGSVKAFITPLTLSEVVYVSPRIYSEAKVENPNQEALKYAAWLLSLSGTKLVTLTEQIALEAGELRKELRISLADCYVVAAGKALNASPLFLKMEREMELHLELLKRLGVEFLEELRC